MTTLRYVDAIPEGGKARGGKWQKVLHEFVASGKQAAEVALTNGQSAKSASSSIWIAIRASGSPVFVATRSGKVYIGRKP